MICIPFMWSCRRTSDISRKQINVLEEFLCVRVLPAENVAALLWAKRGFLKYCIRSRLSTKVAVGATVMNPSVFRSSCATKGLFLLSQLEWHTLPHQSTQTWPVASFSATFLSAILLCAQESCLPRDQPGG